jgi:hypothetical protein
LCRDASADLDRSADDPPLVAAVALTVSGTVVVAEQILSRRVIHKSMLTDDGAILGSFGVGIDSLHVAGNLRES